MADRLVLLGPVKTFAEAGQGALRGRAQTVRAQGLDPVIDQIVRCNRRRGRRLMRGQLAGGLAAKTRGARPLAVAATRLSLAGSPVAGYAAACDALAAAIEPAYERIRAPTLIVAGREDKTSPATTTAFLERRITGAQVVWVENVGHWHVFEDVDGVAAAVRSFF